MALLRVVPWFLCTLFSWFVSADLDVELYRTAKKSPDLKAVEGDVQKISETRKWWKIGWLIWLVVSIPPNSGMIGFQVRDIFEMETCKSEFLRTSNLNALVFDPLVRDFPSGS